nr:ferritin isoform X24 [Bombyx mori]
MNFGKLPLKRAITSQESFARPVSTPSRSPSPLTFGGSPILEVLKTKAVCKPRYPRNPDIRQNALLIFEFSSAYPFVYGNNTFKCFVCSQPYQELSTLKLHVKDAHTFASLKRLINNRRENILKVDIEDLECKLCNHKPRDLVELKRHLNEHGKPVDVDIHDNLIPFKLSTVNGSYKCVICDESFIKVRILVIHMSVHFNNYSCEICGSVFMTLRLLKKHLEVHETGNFPCDKCSKVFSTPYKRTVHVRGVHLKQFPRRCPFCPERFNSNYKRTIHLQDVHNQSTRVHKCETCGRGFNLKYHLICHIRSVHLQERNQQCDVCHQRFCNKESLKRHMVIHTGEKNHKCDICGMAFLRRKNLKDHLRLHEIG